MVWCRQATSHNRSQCWPRSLWPYGVTRPQLVKTGFSLLINTGRIAHRLGDVQSDPQLAMGVVVPLIFDDHYIQDTAYTNLFSSYISCCAGNWMHQYQTCFMCHRWIYIWLQGGWYKCLCTRLYVHHYIRRVLHTCFQLKLTPHIDSPDLICRSKYLVMTGSIAGTLPYVVALRAEINLTMYEGIGFRTSTWIKLVSRILRWMQGKLILISSDTEQFMMCAIDRIHNGVNY